MAEFCAREGLPFEICGKVVVATEPEELDRLEALHQRGLANGVSCELIGPERLRELEPHCTGLRALHVPETGIVDYRGVCYRLAERLIARGGAVRTGVRVVGLKESPGEVVVETTQGEVRARWLVNCAGLHSDRVTAMAGAAPSARIVPFRGEYFEVRPGATHLCRNLIYPVPDPRFPFLGVHFTRMMRGGVECGPNAVLAFAREGYRKTDVDWRDLAETLGYPGFRRLARQHWRMALGEWWRSWSKAAFVRALQRLVPEIRAEDLTPAPAGIRAQAVRPDGQLVDDFVIDAGARTIHVLNAPSPAATAALSIGRAIAETLAARF
jgi:L-2-hydroxyglutarate oxidase LhgO